MVMPSNLGELVQARFPTAVAFRDYLVRDDGAGPYIAYWDAVAMSVAQPTDAQVQSFKAQVEADLAAAKVARQQAIATCRAYDPASATASQVRATLGAALFLLRQVLQDLKP